MDATKTFTDVLDQLQTMELKFASVLMEAALKFTMLADANFFILFESKDGRYYGGKEYLCDGYRNGLLSSTGSDVELEADLDNTTLRPKNTDAALFAENDDSPTPRPPPLATKSLNGDSPTAAASTKRRKRKSLTDDDFAIKQRKIHADKDTLIESVKEEAAFLMEPFECTANDFVEVLDHGDLPDASDINATYEPLTESQSEVSDWFFNELRKNRDVVEKINSVRKLRNAQIQAMTNRESDERKEVLALFYDYGKHFASKFLNKELTRESRDYAFQIFWSHFVNLHPYEELRVPSKFLSSSCKDSFLHPYRRRKRLSMPKITSLDAEFE